MGNFRQQLRPGLDEWLTRLDGTFMAGGMGHHGVSVGDADGDGLDDLFVSQPAGLPDRLFHNNGDGTFTDVSDRAGILKPGGRYALGVVAADFDNDGWPDLYVACDMTPSLLYRNQRDGTFDFLNVMSISIFLV